MGGLACYEPVVLALAIMAEVGGDLRGWLGPRLAAAGFRLDEDGAVRAEGGEPAVASWRLLERAALATRPWHQEASPCPFVDALAGYVVLGPGPDGAVPAALTRAVAHAGRGVVARLDDDRAWPTVALCQVDVEHATSAAGLDDGARLLERDPATAYAADVVARIAAAAAGRGLNAHVVWRANDRITGRITDRLSGRNPVEIHRVQPFGSDQAYPPVWGKAGAAFDPLRALRGLTAELWLHDLTGLDALTASGGHGMLGA